MKAFEGKVADAIDAGVEATGYSLPARVAGAIGKAAVDLALPDNVVDFIPGGKIASGGRKVVGTGKSAAESTARSSARKEAEVVADRTAKRSTETEAKAAAGGGGGYSTKSGKRKPGHRCELVPYEELECPPGSDAHHVVPDFMGRTGTRTRPGQRIPGAPTLGGGLAICLPQPDHREIHRLDKRYKGASSSTRGGAVLGTVTGLQAKAISAANVEKATGGKKGGGCSKAEIQKQLDRQVMDDTILRGEKHAGAFNKLTDAVEAVRRQTGRD